MLQNSLGLIRSVWRFFSLNTVTKNDADAKTILNRCALILQQKVTFWSRLCVSCSGLAKPGEMVLVLGCPGSGCTTFLKAIANDCPSVSGGVCYAGINAVEMEKTYKGEVVYNQDGTKVHY